MIEQKTYLGNPLLKSAYVPQNFSEEQVEEYIKCQICDLQDGSSIW